MSSGTRWYTIPDSTQVSVAYDSVWDDTASVNKGKLSFTAVGATANFNEIFETSATPIYMLHFQLVSDQLSAISATLPDFDAAFKCIETDAKLNGYMHFVIRKCDGDGSNPVTIGTITDDTEYDTGDFEVRWTSGTSLGSQSLNAGDRLVIEIGTFADNTKTDSYAGEIAVSVGSGSFLPESDGVSLNTVSWVSTGDTFSVYVPPVIVYPTSQTLQITTYAAMVGDALHQVASPISATITTYAPTFAFDYKFSVAAAMSITIDPQAPVFNETIAVAAPIAATITIYAPTVGADVTITPAVISLEVTIYATIAGETVTISAAVQSILITTSPATAYSPDARIFAMTIAVEITINNSFVAYDFDTSIEPIYLFELSGTPDVTIPIEQFQARMQNGVESSLTVRIPSLDYQSEIESRSSGEMRIIASYVNGDGVVVSQEIIAWADLEDIRIHEVPGNDSIELSGHKAIEFGGHTREVSGVSYRNMARGKTRIRTAVLNPFLRPGDTITNGDDEFTADEIVYTISPNRQTMEIAEADY